VHQVGDKKKLYCDARSTNHQDMSASRSYNFRIVSLQFLYCRNLFGQRNNSFQLQNQYNSRGFIVVNEWMGSTLKGIEEKLSNIAHHRFMELEDCRGKRKRGEGKGAHCLQSLMMIKLQIKKSWLCRKQILKYYIALKQSIYRVCFPLLMQTDEYFKIWCVN